MAANHPNSLAGVTRRALVAGLLASLAIGSACAAGFSLSGVLRKADGSPLSGATITAVGPDIQVTSNDIPKTFPAGRAETSVATVTPPVTLANVEVYINITHPNISKLQLSIFHPDGTEVVLMDRPGGGGANISQTFTVSAFSGKLANGSWIMSVKDTGSQSTGTLNSWYLRIPGQVITATTGADGSYTLNGLDGGVTYTVSPSYPGMTFDPPSQSLSITSNTIGMDYGQVDTTVPVAAFTAPAGPVAYVSSLSSLAGTAADNTNGSGLSSLFVRLRRAPADGSAIAGQYWNGTGWQTAVADLAYSGFAVWNVTTPLPSGANLPDGLYFAIAFPFDVAGNFKYYGMRIYVDSTAPTVSVSTPADNATISSLASIGGSASDPESGIRNIYVKLRQIGDPRTITDDKYWKPGIGFVSGQAPLLATNNATSWSVTDALPTAGELTPGLYYLYVTVRDKAGNRTDVRTQFTVAGS